MVYASINATTLEYNLAIIIACVPGMKPLLMKVFKLQSAPGTFRMSLNTIVYGPQSAPNRLSSVNPYSGSDIAIGPLAHRHGRDDREPGELLESSQLSGNDSTKGSAIMSSK